MKNSRIMILLAVMVSVLALGVGAVWAAEPTTEQLAQQIEQLQSKIQQLELKVQQLEAKQTEALSVENVDAEQLGEAIPTVQESAEQHDAAAGSQPAPQVAWEAVEEPAEQPVAADQEMDESPLPAVADEALDEVTIADIAEDILAELTSAAANVQIEQSPLPLALDNESQEENLEVQTQQAEEEVEEVALVPDLDEGAAAGDQAEQAETPETQSATVEVAVGDGLDSPDSTSIEESVEALLATEDDVTAMIDDDSPAISQDEPVAMAQEPTEAKLAAPATTQPAAVSSIDLSAIDQAGE